MEHTLRCIRCGVSFTHEGLGRRPTRCRPCRALHKRENASRRQSKWRDANREKHVAYLRAYHQARKDDPEYRRMRREAFLVYKYGITQQELEALIEKQAGRCAICIGLPNGPGSRLHIDHCHDTGRIRGLLCSKCNTAVGLLDNNPDRAEFVAAYLRREGATVAHSPSQKWKDGVLVERAIETNRWKVLPDGTPVGPANEDDTAEDEAPETKAVSTEQAENKAVSAKASVRK